MYAIEKNIPIPAQPKGRPRIYPFPEMKVGDSFYVPKERQSPHFALTMRTSAKRLKIEVHLRNEKHGTRVWRVK